MQNKLAAIACDAGSAILALHSSDLAATAKADGSPLTQADLAANETILKGLAENFPGVPVITEERLPEVDATNARHVFLVDPLDGTRDFLSGNGEYTVNIALLDGSNPIAGVVYAPALGVIYAGAADDGARRAQVTHGVVGAWQRIAATAPSGKLRAVTSRSHPSSKTQEYLDRLAIADFMLIGSSLKFCLIAAGEADIYPRMGQTMEWDTAAGDAILRAAGGAVLALDGKPLRYNKRNAAGEHDLANPWFVATGGFDVFDPKWRRKLAAGPMGSLPVRGA
jgi:3'(2'),5'-bisphosphate nucleotidase